jgi:hypothetical protein
MRVYQVVQLQGEAPLHGYPDEEPESPEAGLRIVRYRTALERKWVKLGVRDAIEAFALGGVAGTFDIPLCAVTVTVRKIPILRHDGTVSNFDFKSSVGWEESVASDGVLRVRKCEVPKKRREKYRARGYHIVKPGKVSG